MKLIHIKGVNHLLIWTIPIPGEQEKLRNKLWSRLIKKGSSADEPASIDFR